MKFNFQSTHMVQDEIEKKNSMTKKIKKNLSQPD